jgi:hypothetical protein
MIGLPPASSGAGSSPHTMIGRLSLTTVALSNRTRRPTKLDRLLGSVPIAGIEIGVEV